MGQMARCPYCEWPVAVSYMELCTLPTPKPMRWAGRCSHCNCRLEASSSWEALTVISSLVALGILLTLFTPYYPDAPNVLGWICAILIGAFLYFFSGLVRYMTFSHAKIS
jgi:hypothetical protein